MAGRYGIEGLKSAIKPIAEKYGVSRVFLFGSYARGEATSQSDIDLRIDKGTLRGFFALSGMHLDLEEVLKAKVDLLTTGSLEDGFLRGIKGEEVLLYERQS